MCVGRLGVGVGPEEWEKGIQEAAVDPAVQGTPSQGPGSGGVGVGWGARC